MKYDFAAAGVYIAAVIGAGFASGSEIVHYFAIYGRAGIFGIFVSALLFGGSASAVLNLSKRYGADNFGELVNKLFLKWTARVVNVCAVLFMFLVFTAMLAGCGEAVCQLTGIRKSVGVVIIIALTVLILFFDMRGLMTANGIMAVLIIVGTMGVCLYLYNFREIQVFAYKGKWAVSGALYTGYNMLTAGAVLPSMRSYVQNSRRVGILSGGCIFVLLTALWGIICIYNGKIQLGAIPMLTICKRHGELLCAVYSAVLFMAMLTTAIANAFALTDSLPGNKKTKIAFLAALGFMFASIPFEFFVGSIYRFAGYAGVMFMVCTIIKNMKYLEKERKGEIIKEK